MSSSLSQSSNPINSTSNKKNCVNCKVLVLGRSGVGKSHMLLKYTAKPGEIIYPTKTTINVDYKESVETVDDTDVKMLIWDTAGQERYRPMIATYFKNAKAAILVFDLTDSKSLVDIRYWVQQVKVQCGKNLVKILVGNKCDLEQGDIDPQLIEEYCQDYDMEYIKTSALEGINVKEVFQMLAKKFLKNIQTQNSLLLKSDSSIINEKQDNGSHPGTSITAMSNINNTNNTNSNNTIKLGSSNPKSKNKKSKSGEDGCC